MKKDNLFKVLSDVFGFNSDIIGIAENVISRIDFNEFDKDDIYSIIDTAMNDELIYYNDQWTMMMFYQLPQEANFENAWYNFEDDLYKVITEIIGG